MLLFCLFEIMSFKASVAKSTVISLFVNATLSPFHLYFLNHDFLCFCECVYNGYAMVFLINVKNLSLGQFLFPACVQSRGYTLQFICIPCNFFNWIS